MGRRKGPPKIDHRFLDEAGDTTFYGKGKILNIGQEGVSCSFILGSVSFKEPIDSIRAKIVALRETVEADPYYRDIPSVQKRINNKGFYFHATDDIPEIRKVFFEFIKGINCSFEAVVGKKIPGIYEKKHNGNESEFYADLLSHLLKNKFGKEQKMVINIAERGKSTKNANLELARKKAETRFINNTDGKEIKSQIVFNVQNHYSEPLLNVADYFCWSIQRVFERGEIRYYNYLAEKIPVIIDLYDDKKYNNWQNYYGPKNPLTAENKISPPLH